MTKNKTTKRALLVSVLALLLCASLLVGSTFAWFTDSVTSTNNIIKSGNLDIKLEYSKDFVNWNEVKADTNMFSNGLWEPGYTEVVYLRISNVGSLALKYALEVNVASEESGTNQEGKEFWLSDHIVYGVDTTVTEKYADRAAAQAAIKDSEKALREGYATTNNPLEAKTNNVNVAALVVYMPTTVGNVANHDGKDIPSINLGITLNATQLTFEEDSFGKDYDEDAVIVDKEYTAGNTELADVLANINAAQDETVLIQLDKDVTWETGSGHGSTPWANVDAKVKTLIVDGNGHTITATGAGVGSIRMANGGLLVFKDVTIEDESVSYAESSWEFTYLEFSGLLKFDNVTFKSGIQVDSDNGQSPKCVAEFTNCAFISEEDDVYGAWIGHGSASFVNCTFTGTRGLKTHEAYGSQVEEIVVDNCTFGPLEKKPGIAIGTVDVATTITIKNSTFAGVQAGDQGKYIYETDTDVTTFVFTEKDNIVSKYVDVASASDLAEKLKGAGQAGAKNTVIRLNADMDLTGINWTPIKVDGYHGADIVTVDGQGHTITGLTAPLFAGGFAGGSGIVIKDLTIADSEIVSTSTQGSGAFVECSDSMDRITLTNCHLKNSTLSGSRTGGLIGWTAGYNNVNDGPVKSYITVENCSVVGCEINGAGSVGGVIGHSGGNAWTFTVVKNTVVKDCKLNSTDSGDWRVGVVIGTVNVGEQNDISGITASGNTLTQTGKTAPAGQSDLYGRFVPGSTGKLTIDGVAIN